MLNRSLAGINSKRGRRDGLAERELFGGGRKSDWGMVGIGVVWGGEYTRRDSSVRRLYKCTIPPEACPTLPSGREAIYGNTVLAPVSVLE